MPIRPVVGGKGLAMGGYTSSHNFESGGFHFDMVEDAPGIVYIKVHYKGRVSQLALDCNDYKSAFGRKYWPRWVRLTCRELSEMAGDV